MISKKNLMKNGFSAVHWSKGVSLDATISYLLQILVMERFILTKVWQNTSAAASTKLILSQTFL